MHDYSPQQALKLLVGKLSEKDPELGRQISSAIDSGKDAEEKESRRGRKKQRVYRKAVPFTEEEALQVAFMALQACFVEQPLFVNSASANFRSAAVGAAAEKISTFRGIELKARPEIRQESGSPKILEIELQTETQLIRQDQQTYRLKPVSEQTIKSQRENMVRLSKLLEFKEEK